MTRGRKGRSYPELASLLRDSGGQRRERIHQSALTLSNRGHSRAGVTLEHATVVMWTFIPPRAP